MQLEVLEWLWEHPVGRYFVLPLALLFAVRALFPAWWTLLADRLRQWAVGPTRGAVTRHASQGLRALALRPQRHYVQRRYTQELPRIARDAEGRLLSEEEFAFAAPTDSRTLEALLHEQLEHAGAPPKRYLILAGGGMGKSELLLRLFRRTHRRFGFRQNLPQAWLLHGAALGEGLAPKQDPSHAHRGAAASEVLPEGRPAVGTRHLLLVDALDEQRPVGEHEEPTELRGGEAALARLRLLLAGSDLDARHPLKPYLGAAHALVTTARLASVYEAGVWRELATLCREHDVQVRYLLPLDPDEAGARLLRKLFPRFTLRALPGRQRRRRERAADLLRANPVFGRPLLASYLPLFVDELYRLAYGKARASEAFGASAGRELPPSFWATLEEDDGQYLSRAELAKWLRDYQSGDRHQAADVAAGLRDVDRQQVTNQLMYPLTSTLRVQEGAFDSGDVHAVMQVVTSRWAHREAKKFGETPRVLLDKLQDFAVRLATEPAKARLPKLELRVTGGKIEWYAALGRRGLGSILAPIPASSPSAPALTFAHRRVHKYFLKEWTDGQDPFQLATRGDATSLRHYLRVAEVLSDVGGGGDMPDSWARKDGATLLMAAAEAGSLSCVAWLLSFCTEQGVTGAREGADARKSDNGFTALMAAALNGYADCARAILGALGEQGVTGAREGADARKPDDGVTALMAAAQLTDVIRLRKLRAALLSKSEDAAERVAELKRQLRYQQLGSDPAQLSIKTATEEWSSLVAIAHVRAEACVLGLLNYFAETGSTALGEGVDARRGTRNISALMQAAAEEPSLPEVRAEADQGRPGFAAVHLGHNRCLEPLLDYYERHYPNQYEAALSEAISAAGGHLCGYNSAYLRGRREGADTLVLGR